jgi:hypothetical protein
MADEHGRSPGVVPFWAHQLAEMLLGVLLLVEGARTDQHTAVLAGTGAALVLLALMSDGAFGAWPWIGRRVHRVLDFVAAVVLALLPLVLSLDAVLAIVVLEAAALGMAWLALRTNWSVRTRRRSTPGPPAAPTAMPPPEPAPPLARTLGAAVGKARARGPRQLGRAVGRVQRAARSAGGSTRPEPPGPGAPPAGDPTPTDPS